LSAEALRELFAQNVEHPTILRQLSDELSNRHRNEAKSLKKAVDAQIEIIARARGATKKASKGSTAKTRAAQTSSTAPSERPILCVDFGTSSIRAALRPRVTQPPFP